MSRATTDTDTVETKLDEVAKAVYAALHGHLAEPAVVEDFRNFLKLIICFLAEANTLDS